MALAIKMNKQWQFGGVHLDWTDECSKPCLWGLWPTHDLQPFPERQDLARTIHLPLFNIQIKEW